MTVAAPSGVVTVLFTDVEGSTRRWEADADAMRVALVARDLPYMPNRARRTALTASAGPLTSTCAAR
jgi:class 3 adenylate cyclase